MCLNLDLEVGQTPLNWPHYAQLGEFSQRLGHMK